MLVVASCLVGNALPAASAQHVLLAWRWRPGDERRYQVESTFNQSIQYDRTPRNPARDPAAPAPRRPVATDPDQTRRINCTQIFTVVERVTGVDEAGVATVTHTYERIQVRGTDAGPDGTETFEYDSALRRATAPSPSAPAPSPPVTQPAQSPRQRLQNPTSDPRPAPNRAPPPGSSSPGSRDNPDHPLIAPFASLAGRTITYQIDAEGRVLSCQGGDEALEGVFSLGAGDSPMNPLVMLFQAAVTNDSLAQQCQQGLALIPNRHVRRGETWPLNLSQTLPLVGVLRSNVTCRLASFRGQTATIENKGELALEGGPSGVQGLGGLFEIHLGSSEMTGTTEFDTEGGFVRAQRQRMVSQWEAYAPDWEDLDRLGEPVKVTQRLEQDMSMRLEP